MSRMPSRTPGPDRIAARLVAAVLVAGLAAAVAAPLAALPFEAVAAPAAGPATPNLGPPLDFEANRGQLDARALYRMRAPGYTAFVTRSGLVLDPGGDAAAVALEPIGAGEPEVVPSPPLPGRSHYFVGGAPARWRTGVPHHAEVLFRGLYPGVDLRLRDGGGGLRYDFELAPGADPGRVRLAVRGALAVRRTAGGGLVIESAGGGRIEQPAPVLYQPAGGERRPVAGGYRVARGGDGAWSVGFEVGPYDRSRPLVIDPTVLVFSTYLGGGGLDVVARVTFDGDGDVYLVGSTDSADFPEVGGVQSGQGGGSDAFVAKMAADGSALLWSTYLGGSGDDFGIAVAVDAADNAYVTGETASVDLPVTAGVVDPDCGLDGACDNGQPDAFVAKIGPAGNALLFLTYLGAESYDRGNGVFADAAGTVYVSGRAESQQFPTTAGAFQETPGDVFSNVADAFVVRLDAAASTLLFSTYLGATGDDDSFALAVDGAGEVTVTGSTFSDDFPVAGVPAPFQSTRAGIQTDAWVARLTADASALVYSTYLGGVDLEFPLDLEVDAAGNAWVGGYTQSPDFPTAPPPGAAAPFQPAFGGGRDGFVTAVDPSGSALYASTYFGGSLFDEIFSLALVPGGGVAVSGSTFSADLPVRDAFQPVPAQAFGRDGFVAQLAGEGARLAFSTYFGGAGDDFVNGVERLPGGDFVFAGATDSDTGFPLLAPLRPLYGGGGADGFVARLRYVPRVQEIPTLSAAGLAGLAALTVLSALALLRRRG